MNAVQTIGSVARLRGATRHWTLLALLCWSAGVSASEAPPPGYESAPLQPGSIAWQLVHEDAQRRQHHLLLRVPIPEAVSESVVRDESVNRPPPPVATVTVLSEEAHQQLFWGSLALVGLGVLLLRWAGPAGVALLLRRFNPWALQPLRAGVGAANLLAEDQALTEFIAAFKSRVESGGGVALPEPELAGPQVLDPFLAGLATEAVALRELLHEATLQTERAVMMEQLWTLGRRLHALVEKVDAPERRPLWQLATALDGLLKQLLERANTLTPSALRTLGGGVDLLGELCQPGLPSNLLTEPPLRFLAVDDDPICLKAVSRALGRVLRAPDEAKDGLAGLALAEVHAYDVVFLDVQMPGMDGFEMCSRLLQTQLNRRVPVVFVTCLDDFDSRARSTLAGGNDLIAKPFLTFEITVKALTLAVRTRLARRLSATQLAATPAEALLPAVQPAGAEADTAEGASAVAGLAPLSEQALAEGQERAGETTSAQSATLPAPALTSADARGVLLRAAKSVAAMQGVVAKLKLAAGATAQQELVSDLFLLVHGLVFPPELDYLRPAAKVRGALEILLTKLVERQGNLTSGVVETLGGALELLERLCVHGLDPALVSKPPVRLLVVDDDPISRRIVANALQVVFPKPESASSGEAALQLAAKEPFDGVFLDVVMPGLDGFGVCTRLRQTRLNARTPVVFVTRQNDEGVRERAVAAGGNGLLLKPFLASELTLRALTLVLQNRLAKAQAAGAPQARTPKPKPPTTGRLSFGASALPTESTPGPVVRRVGRRRRAGRSLVRLSSSC